MDHTTPCSGAFWSLLVGWDVQINFPFWDHSRLPFGGPCLIWANILSSVTYGAVNLHNPENIGHSMIVKSSGCGAQIFHFRDKLCPISPLHSPLNFWKASCGVICLLDLYPHAKFHHSAINNGLGAICTYVHIA